MRRIDALLKEFVAACKQKFGANIVSIVLFGSYARGTATRHSDVDILVVADNLPGDWRERDGVLSDAVIHALKHHHRRIFPIVTTPEAMENSQIIGNPLLYGILTGYEILYDRGNFFAGILRNTAARARTEKPILYDKVKTWHLARM